MNKSELEAQNALLAKALEQVANGPAAVAEPTPEPKVRKLASLVPVPDTAFGITPEPRGSGKHVVSVITLHKDGSPVMSAGTGAPRKPIRIPLPVAAYLLTDDGQDALSGIVESLA